MKTLKIFLAVAVVAVIGYFVWMWSVSLDERKNVEPPKNQFTARIESEIDSLRKAPDNMFCQHLYNNIQYRISDYYKQRFLGKSEKDNDQWREIFSKNLYSAYAAKFVAQAMYVFNRSEWKTSDLSIIRSEVKTLSSSSYLEPNSDIALSFKNISFILAKYDEITAFINTCNGFSFTNYDLSIHFPDVSDKIKKSQAYLANNLDNSYVNNCARLKDGLKMIPKTLFDKHIGYLTKKINDNGARYTEYNYQLDYSNTVYTPINNQIEAIERDMYGVSEIDFDNGLINLITLLGKYNREAMEYFRNRINLENRKI